MLIIATSPSAISVNGAPDPNIVSVLIEANQSGNPVGVISNHRKPAWFDGAFGGTGVQFIQERGRQDGEILRQNCTRLSLSRLDVIVLAANIDDVKMGKNSGAVLVAAGWGSSDPQIQNLGIRVEDSQELREMLEFSAQWPGGWWYSNDVPGYSIRALADLSGYGREQPQVEFSRKLTQTVKNGGARLNALLAITSRSLLSEGFGREEGLVWGIYPSSHSENNDTDTLSDFGHRLRTTVSRVQFARRGRPLFVRHKASPKRSSGQTGDREDPTTQLTTLHLNPFYREKDRLVHKHVVVIDDCTTYGVSFGVAAAFLKAAGARKVTCVALGKFGQRINQYDISINSDPFCPVSQSDIAYEMVMTSGMKSGSSQHQLRSLIR